MSKCVDKGYIPYVEINVCSDCIHKDVCGDKDYLTENRCSEKIRGNVKHIAELVDAEEQGLLVRLHEGTSFKQIRAIMRFCERLNGIKARKGQEIEPMITWQLYDILCEAFRIDEEAEKALEEAQNSDKR